MIQDKAMIIMADWY